MRITFLGVLSILAVFILLAYAGQQVERKWNETKERDEQARKHAAYKPDETDTF